MSNTVKHMLLGIFTYMWFSLLSCTNEQESNNNRTVNLKIHFDITNITPSTSRAPTGITNIVMLDSLIHNMRVLIMNTSGVCEAYADISSVKLSLGNRFNIVSPIGIKDFIFLTNIVSSTWMDNPIGKTKQQILVSLPQTKTMGSYFKYQQAPQLFFSEVTNVTVQSGVVPIEVSNLNRIVSQIETSVLKDVYHIDGSGNKTTPFSAGYLQRIDSLYIYNVSPDINLLFSINNRSGAIPGYDLTNTIIESSQWQTTHANTTQNVTLSFPTEGQNRKPYLLFAAEVDQNNSDYIATANPVIGPHGGIIRYWSFQLNDHHFRPNKRLQLNVSALLGGGSATPMPPLASAQIEFTIQQLDWELVSDTITGGKDDFLP